MLSPIIFLFLSFVTIGDSLRCPLQGTAPKIKLQSFQFGFEQEHPLGETVFLINNQKIVRVNGGGSKFCAIPLQQKLTYRNRTVKFIDRTSGVSSTPQVSSDINVLTIFTNVNGLFEMQALTKGTSSNFSLSDNGYFYFDNDGRALFTNTLIVESLRPFPPLFDPPTEILFVVRGHQPNDVLVLNIDSTADRVAEISDDIIVLTGSKHTAISYYQTLLYIANSSMIFIQNGDQIIDTISGINYFRMLKLDSASGKCSTQYYTDIQNSLHFRGPGTLYSNGGRAFYTNISSIQTVIGDQIIGGHFKIITSSDPEPSSIRIQSTLGPSAGNDLIELVGVVSTTLYTASSIRYSTGILTLIDNDANLLKEIGTATSPIDLNIFFDHQVQQFSRGHFVSLAVPQEGLSLTFNSQTNTAFAYPASNYFLRNLISRAEIPPQPLYLYFESDRLGGASLIGHQSNGYEIEVLRISNSGYEELEFVIYINRGDIIRYTGNKVIVNRAGKNITFCDINLFSANHTYSSILDLYVGGEAIQTYSGPGYLYIDHRRQAFFTWSRINLFRWARDSFRSVLPQLRSTINDNGTTVINIESAFSGNSYLSGVHLVEVSSSKFHTVSSYLKIYYFDKEVNEVHTMKIHLFSRAIFYPTASQVNITYSHGGVSRIIPVEDLYAYTSLGCGGTVELITEQTTFPYGGVLYLGRHNRVLYTLNSRINQPIVDTINFIGARTGNVISSNEFNYYNETRRSIQQFYGSAPILIPGGGVIFTSNLQSYYTIY